jgi:hypothetical protein
MIETRSRPYPGPVEEAQNDHSMVAPIRMADIIDEDMVARYTEKFGKKPHPLIKPETMKARLGE